MHYWVKHWNNIKMGRIEELGSSDAASVVQDKHDSDIQIEKSKKKHKCNYPDCSAVFLRPSRLERHIRSHTGEKPYKCSHPECTKSYTNSSHLKRHLETHNPTRKVYKCTKCSIGILGRHNLKRHYNRMHNEEKRITCKECNETFNKKYQLVKHQAVQHSVVPMTYKCDKCVQSFSNQSKLKRHQKTHERRYPCPVPGCSEIFNVFHHLRTHKRMKHITQYKCDTCDKIFFSKVHLRTHSKIHSKDRLVLPCPYDNCHRIYFFKSNLYEHVRIKHFGKKFYCDTCFVGLSSKQKLIEHIQLYHCEKDPKKKKVRAQRKKRKDAGVPKKSVLTALIGVNVPHYLEKMIMERETTVNSTAKVSI